MIAACPLLGLWLLFQAPVPAPQTQNGNPVLPPEPPASQATPSAPKSLPEVVVTATRRTEDLFDVPRSMTIVPRQELLERAPRTAAEAIRFKPGIWVQKTGHLGGAPVIRGFIGNRVVYLFDGIRRNTASLFAGPNSFLQNIDALDIDRVEVVRGPGSVLYGSDAIGGVVNVITDEDLLFSKGLETGGRLYGRFASADHETSSRAEGYFTTSRVNGFVGVTRRNIQDLNSGRGGGVQAPATWFEHDWDAQVGTSLGDGQRLDLFVQSFTRPEGRRFDRPDWFQRNDRDLWNLRYRGKDLSFADHVEVKLYYHSQVNFIDAAFFDSDSRDRTIGGEFQADSKIGKDFHLVYGASGLRDSVDKSNPQKGTVDPHVDWRNLAGYALGEWQASDHWRVDAGLRLDQFNLQSDSPPLARLDSRVRSAVQNGSLPLSSLNQDTTDLALTGGFGLTYFVTDDVSVYSHIGRAFRAPNKADKLAFGPFTFGFGVPSPNLRSESSWTYEIGSKAQGKDFSYTVAGYMTVLSDGILSQPGTFNGSSFIDINGNGVQDAGEQVFVKRNSRDDIVVHGVELQGVQYLPEAWSRALSDYGAFSLYGNFTWMRGRARGTGEPLDRGIPTNGLLGVRWENAREASERRSWIELETWAVNSFDRIPSTRGASDPAFRKNPQDRNSPFLATNAQGAPRVPGFTIFNVRAGLKINKAATLTLSVENITDKLYRVKDSRIDAPGISFLAAMELVF